MLPASIANLDPVKVLASAKPLTKEDMPGMMPSRTTPDLSKFTVRYQKLCLSEVGDLAELARIETKAIRNQGIYVMSKVTYTFLENMFMIISYMEVDE